MDKQLTEIIFLLDRSGSMQGLETDTIGGFNSFVEKQAQQGRTLLTTVLFDDRYEILHNGCDAAKARLDAEQYYTRGSTALLDAVGKTILDVGLRLAKTPEPERPGKILFVITTDGQENASTEFSYSKIQEMITHQRDKYGWEFIFMGANIDVEQESGRLGIDARCAVPYAATKAGTEAMFSKVAEMASELRKD